MGSIVKTIPETLIYEMVNDKPIYYRGYRAYLEGHKSAREIMGSSKLQAFLIAELIFLLKTQLGKQFLIFTNELGVQFSKKSWRAVDIAVINRDETVLLNDKYLEVPPQFVFEIDTKAELLDLDPSSNYYYEKTDELLDFGVEKVVWIFTGSKKIMLASKDQDWVTRDWHQDVSLSENLNINIAELLSDLPPEMQD